MMPKIAVWPQMRGDSESDDGDEVGRDPNQRGGAEGKLQGEDKNTRVGQIASHEEPRQRDRTEGG